MPEPLPGPPPPSPGAPRWRETFLLMTVAFVGLIGLGAWRVVTQFKHLKTEAISLHQRNMLAEGQLKELQAREGQLNQQLQQITMDRDNMRTQLTNAVQTQQETQEVRGRLEEAFQQAETERLTLLARLEPMDDQLLALMKERDDLQQKHDTVGQQFTLLQEQVRTRSEEKRLREKLAQGEKKRSELERQLRDNEQKAAKLNGDRAKAAQELAALQKRYEPLQEKYAELLSENKSMKKKVERLPSDITDLTREHERLMKDLADTHYNMGVMFAKKRDFVRAASEFQKTIEIRPDDAEAYYNLGVIYAEHLPDRDRAMALFRHFLNISPKGQQANWAQQYIASWQAWEAKDRLE